MYAFQQKSDCAVNIDRLIKENRSFALYRYPQENHIHFVMQKNDSTPLLYRIHELNNQNAYIIAPFHISAKHPIVLICPDIEKIYPVPEITEFYEQKPVIDPYPTAAYTHRFSTFVDAVNDGRFEKLVLSRKKEIGRNDSFSPEQAFYIACKKYPYSYVYIYQTPQTGTWLGCTPEILLSGENAYWQTVALAGTQPLKTDKLPATWDDKNKQEQKMVATYIRKQLEQYHIQPSEEGPYTIRAGKLAHLKSVFRFSIPDRYRLGDLLNELHPTPATCGLPRNEARQFIMEQEGYDRSYYSGFIGRLQPEGHTDIYVNLRCMQIEAQKLILYAGGGILPSSELNDEWMETENKLQTMLTLSKSDVHR